MTAISAPFTGQNTKLYAKASAHTLSTLAAGDLVGEVQNIGDIELSANIIDVMRYGDEYNGKLVGKKDSGTVDITLNWTPGSSGADDLLKASYEGNAKVYLVVVWSDGGTGVAACDFAGFVSSYSISSPLEDVVTINITVTIEGAVTFDNDGTLG